MGPVAPSPWPLRIRRCRRPWKSPGAGAEVVSLIAEDRGIADLGGIEQLTRLEALDLSHNEITDISP